MDAATFNSTDSVRKGKGKHEIFLLWGFASGQTSWPFLAPTTASCVCPALEDGRFKNGSKKQRNCSAIVEETFDSQN